MGRSPTGRCRAALAGAVTWVAVSACASHVEDRSLHPKDPAAEWEAEFARGKRFEGGGMFDLAERRYRQALRAARA